MIHQREDSSAACQDHQPEVHETMRVHVSHWIKVAVVIGLLLAFIPSGSAQQKLKAGFIYVGPLGDYGWTHAHEVARQIISQKLPIDTLKVESVPAGGVEPFIARLVRQAASATFTTRFG